MSGEAAGPRTGIVRDDRFLDHDMGPGHPESPRRLEAIHEAIDAAGLALRLIPARPATEAEVEAVHAPEYVRFLKATAGRPRVVLDGDTSTSPLSYATALLAAGGTIEAAERVLSGDPANGFALVRPPGHHAERGQAMGFCLCNNIAIAAESLLRGGLKKVLIADWDLHHGNGTQHHFYARRDVLYFSTHQAPYYPGTGSRREAGAAEGEGFTVNVPLRPGKGDADYLYIYRRLLGPIAEAYGPEIILVSAGFDNFAYDPLGGMKVGLRGFAALAREMVTLAGRLCGGRLLLVLEGGYHFEGEALAVVEVLRQLQRGAPDPGVGDEPSAEAREEIAAVREIQKSYWPL